MSVETIDIHLPELMSEMWGISRSEARRRLESGGVTLDGVPFQEVDLTYDTAMGHTIKCGRREIYLGRDGLTHSGQAPIDPLDLSGAAEAAAALARRRLVSLTEDLAQETDAAKIRDLAVGLAALTQTIEGLDELANRDTLHKALLATWRSRIQALLEHLTDREWNGDLEYSQELPTLAVTTLDDRNEEVGQHRFVSNRTTYGLVEMLRLLDDRLYGWKEA